VLALVVRELWEAELVQRAAMLDWSNLGNDEELLVWSRPAHYELLPW